MISAGIGSQASQTRASPCAAKLRSSVTGAVAVSYDSVPAARSETRKSGRPESEASVTSEWQYQVRFDAKDSATAESLRRKHRAPAVAPLLDALAKHRATPKCQFDAFAEYVAEAEEQGVESDPLYQWTKATIENPAKKEKYLKSFALYVDDQEVYAKDIADALEADLQPFATSGLITRISKYDTNPANNPQPPQRPHEQG
ncbi:hypothetical protein [Bradyrhizobium sp. STM 3562]|uniref:hypothetical protein n=1 Tax=Bradyrhizobium sp. STM 3562 TaxID=578924 RepID=UPI00388F12C4